jgi:hypothetical protein
VTPDGVYTLDWARRPTILIVVFVATIPLFGEPALRGLLNLSP